MNFALIIRRSFLEYLNIFDFIHTRTESAFPALQKVMPGRCAVGPDIVRSLVAAAAAETEKKQIIDSSNVSTNDCFFHDKKFLIDI